MYDSLQTSESIPLSSLNIPFLFVCWSDVHSILLRMFFFDVSMTRPYFIVKRSNSKHKVTGDGTVPVPFVQC